MGVKVIKLLCEFPSGVVIDRVNPEKLFISVYPVNQCVAMKIQFFCTGRNIHVISEQCSHITRK